MIAAATAFGAAIAMALAAVRLIGGPTLQDRVLAANLVIVLAALLCGAVAALEQAPGAIDVAFALLLGAYVANLAALKVFKLGTFQAGLSREQG